mgnify:CR=1 FL=1
MAALFSMGRSDGPDRSKVTQMSVRIIAASLATALLLAGCANTIRGAGQDVRNTADATQSAVTTVTE